MKLRLILLLFILALLAFPISSYAEDTTPPDVTITSGPSGTLEYRDVGFRWTASDNKTSSADLQYSYRLSGKNDNWSPWSSKNNKLYPVLSDGEYTFELRAKDGEGNIGSGLRTFTVEPGGYWDDKWAQDPSSENYKNRVENPDQYDVQGLRVNADFKVDLGESNGKVEKETYWVPAAILGTPDDKAAEIFDLYGKPDTAKMEIDVLYEALVFVHLNLKPGIHNADTSGQNNIRWEFPKPAVPAIKDGEVNCASTANVIRYLLEDDYEDVGFVWRARDNDSDDPGGHCTSYIKHNDTYYFFDPVSLAENKSHYPVEDGDGSGYHVDGCDYLIQSTPRKYAIFWTQRASRDQAIFSLISDNTNHFALGNKGGKFYYPKAFDGSRLTIWLDPSDTEELLEATYSPDPPTNQYGVEDYSNYPPFNKYNQPEGDQGDDPTIEPMPSDMDDETAQPGPSLIDDLTLEKISSTKIELKWNNPPDNDLSEVMLTRKEGSYPEEHGDGTIIYQNTSPTPKNTDSYTDAGLDSSKTYYYAAFGKIDSGLWNDTVMGGYNANYCPLHDTNPPSPDPMTWKTKPRASGTGSISMVATSAVDSEVTDVKYYFEEITGHSGGDSSGWQDSSTYKDIQLEANTEYCYRVKAKDKSANETGWSKEVCRIAGFNTTLKSGWNIISPPGIPQNQDVETSLGDDLESVILFYDYSDGNYTTYPYDTNSINLEWKQGYWVHLNRKVKVDMAATLPEQEQTLKFTNQGWHLIGLPYPVGWSKASLDDPSDFANDGAGNVRLVAWSPKEDKYLNHYTDTSYVLSPWGGYWVYVKDASSSEPATITVSYTLEAPSPPDMQTPLPQSVNRKQLDYPPLPQELDDSFQALAYPNPVMEKEQVTFAARMANVEKIKVTVANTAGEVVYNSGYKSGSKLTWGLKSSSGNKVANGIYLYKIQTMGAGGTTQASEVRRLLVLR